MIYCSVSSIVNYYYPYKEHKETPILRKGIEAEWRTRKKIRHTHYQKKLSAVINFDDISVHIRGVVDFLLIYGSRYVVYEKKNYPLTHPKVRGRIQLQLSLYALLLSENYPVLYDQIELMAIDGKDNIMKMDPIPRKQLLQMIYRYAKTREIIRNVVIGG